MDETLEDTGRFNKAATLFGLLVIAGLIAVISLFCSVKIAPTQVGILTSQFQIPFIAEQGVQPHALAPGYQYFIPFVQRIEIVDTAVKSFRMSKYHNGSRDDGGPVLEIRTRDESTVFLDVTVLYQVDRAHAATYWQNVGKSKLLVTRLDNKVRDSMKLYFGQLSRDEFYSDAKGREHLAARVVEELNKELDAKIYVDGEERLKPDAEGVIVLDILISDFHYTDDYEHKIREKSLTEEEAAVQRAREKAESMKALVMEAQAKGEAEYLLIKDQGEAVARKTRADADLIYTSELAQGDLAVLQADALGKRILSDAFDGSGGKHLSALEQAKVLQGIKTLILSSDGKDGLNPLDTPKMLRMYGVSP